jgi:hypothetical protein
VAQKRHRQEGDPDSSKFQVPSSKFQVPSSKFQVQDAGGIQAISRWLSEATPPDASCKRHASVGLVPAGQQLSSYAPTIVAICSDGFRRAGCPKETFWRDELSRISGVPIGCENTQAIGGP